MICINLNNRVFDIDVDNFGFQVLIEMIDGGLDYIFECVGNVGIMV